MNLDDVRIGVRPGAGIVARLPGTVLVVPFDDGPVDQAAVDRLLEECRKGPVASRLDEVRAAATPGVGAFALIGEVRHGLALFVSGDVDAAIAGGEPVLRLSGLDMEGWTVRVPEGFATVELGRLNSGPIDPRLDLQAGVVSGSGVTLWPTRAAISAAAVDAPAVAAAPGPMAAPAPMAADRPAPTKATRRKRAAPAVDATPVAEGVPVAVPAVAATPVAAPAPPPVAPAPPPMAAAVTPIGPPEVWGIRCKKGHFNDPEARYCGICGIHMVQDKVARVKGPRPVLGFLVLDDGTSFKLDTDYVLGSDPHADEAVTSGQARPLVVRADGDVISPIHARVALKDWDVFVSDCGSVYGTYVWSPGGADWQRLAPEQPVKLGAGSQVMVAQRGFMFQPANKR